LAKSTKKPDNCRVFQSHAISCQVVRAGIEPATHGFSVNEKTANSTEKTPVSGQGTAHLQRLEFGDECNGELASAGTDQSPVTQTVLNYIAERLTVLEQRRWTT
jgi:hypothetical protein